MSKYSYFLLGVLLIIPQCCSAYKMLMIMAGGSKSHKHFYSSVAEALAEKGHQITFINPFQATSNKSNIEEIKISKNFFGESMPNAFELSMLQMSKLLMERMPQDCVDSMLEDHVQEVLGRDFDLVLLPFSMSDCYFSYIYRTQVPFVYIFPTSMFGQNYHSIGNLPFLSAYGSQLLEFTHPMTFTQRLINMLYAKFATLITLYVGNPRVENECRRRGVWPPDMPSLKEMQDRSSLTIINSVRALESPARPYTPVVISAGGLHVKDAKPLPQELENWIQDSGEDGFIFFSLGTQVKPSDMKEEHRQAIVNVFNSLKQRVIWKWDQHHMEGLSSNVKLGAWFPQADILGHPKIRLFITHGGLLSTQESTYFGVPTIGMPVFIDQFSNVFRMSSEGWGLRIDWKDLTEDKFRQIILDALTNQSIREKVEIRSRLMKDRPLSASEEVNYWVEYVLRYDGAKHLDSPFKDLSWYKIYNVDVWMTVIAALISASACLLFALKCCFRRIGKKLKRKLE